MKSVTLPRSDDKRIVRSALPSSKIFTAAVARLYIAFPNTNEWKYSGIWGAIVFCRDKQKKDSFFIRMVDMENGRGIVWEQELFYEFEYIKDTSFFHTFLTDECLAGILFVHQGEADVFYEKVLNRDLGKAKDDSKPREMKSNGVGLVKYTPGKGFTVENNDPEILEILSELENIEDFSAADVDRNQDFIQDFIQQYKANKKQDTNLPAEGNRRAPPPPPPPSRRGTNRSNIPPPPIPPTNKRHMLQSPAPPPPPMPSKNTALSPPPPPPPNRGTRQTSFTNNATSSAAPPPPPPPPPMTTGAPPAPPPPPPIGLTSSPKPTAVSPPLPSGRNDLMAAIRGTGGFGSLKKGGSLRNVPQTNSRPISATSTNSSSTNASMASSLAAVLEQRKAAMQSDGEEDEDDDDWK